MSLSLALLAALLLPAAPGAPLRSAPAAPQRPAPAGLYEVVSIVDGDTIHVLRDGKKEKLRFLSVDTEEKFSEHFQGSASKPQTVFGEETKLWAIDFLEQFRGEDGAIRVGLAFPNGQEERDVYGRLLCHVVLADGTDFNLLLVKLGKSPYFNKYGNSRICHTDFVTAQAEARRNLLGIWNPRTNAPRDEDAPAARRPYDRLLPWWQARAEAIEVFRERALRAPGTIVAADDPEGLAAALESGREVELFGTPERFFEETDGSLTVLFRSPSKDGALRVSIPGEARATFDAADLEGYMAEYRQNYALVRGVVTRGPRGFRVVTADPERWRRAGPEPELPSEE